MKSLRLKNLVAVAVVASMVATLSSIGASAEWKQDSNGWWNTEGKSYSIGWRAINGSWYNFGQDGYMKTGWIKDGSTWYYMQPSGAMKTGWVNDGGTWYYLAQSGAMKTGWINDNGVWYFAASSGAMQTGAIEVEGKVYYLAPSGAMQKGNVTIDGVIYTFAASGEAIGNKIPTPAIIFTPSGVVVTPPAPTPTPAPVAKNNGGGGSSSNRLSDLSDGGSHTGNYAIYTGGEFGSSDSSKVTTIDGNVSISDTDALATDSITLQNLKITGTLNIDFGNGDVTLNNVIVNGVNVSNVGSSSLHAKGNSSIENLEINDTDNNARIVVEGNAAIEDTTILSGAQLEVAPGATNANVFANVTVSPSSPSAQITLKGSFNSVVVNKPSSVSLQGSIGTISLNGGATGAQINIPAGTTVAKLNIKAAIAVAGTGTIATANLGVSGITMETRPTNIGIMPGVIVIIAGEKVDENSPGVTIIDDSISEFQKDINSKYIKYTDHTVYADFSGDTVTLSVVFDEPVDDSKTGDDDYVRQEVFVTNADGTDEGITYDSNTKEYTAKVGAKVYVSVRVYRNGQIGYVNTAPYIAVPEEAN